MGANSTNNSIMDTAKKGAKDAEKAVKNGVHSVEKNIKNGINAVEKNIKKGVKTVEKTVKKGISSVEGVAGDCRATACRAKDDAVKGVNNTAEGLKDEVKKVVK